MANTKLAKRIADYLFINGAGQQADRLVLMLPDERDGGGWCKQAAMDQIDRAIREESPSTPDVPAEMPPKQPFGW